VEICFYLVGTVCAFPLVYLDLFTLFLQCLQMYFAKIYYDQDMIEQFKCVFFCVCTYHVSSISLSNVCEQYIFYLKYIS